MIHLLCPFPPSINPFSQPATYPPVHHSPIKSAAPNHPSLASQSKSSQKHIPQKPVQTKSSQGTAANTAAEEAETDLLSKVHDELTKDSEFENRQTKSATEIRFQKLGVVEGGRRGRIGSGRIEEKRGVRKVGKTQDMNEEK